VSPLGVIEKVAAAHIPIILVAGDADMVVPFSENGAILAQRYKEAGGEIKVIVKEGVGHHPHSLSDPELIFSYIVKYVEYRRQCIPPADRQSDDHVGRNSQRGEYPE